MASAHGSRSVAVFLDMTLSVPICLCIDACDQIDMPGKVSCAAGATRRQKRTVKISSKMMMPVRSGGSLPPCHRLDRTAFVRARAPVMRHQRLRI